MPGTKQVNEIFNSRQEEIEVRRKIIEECIEYLENIGYYGGARLLRADLIEHTTQHKKEKPNG
jgi:hypothetical protein